MFVINEDMSIYITRGDIAYFIVSATDDNGNPYKFKAGDIVRMKVFDKKGCETVHFQKDFGITENTEEVEILLEEKETKIGDVISKPKDYWYEIELNPYDNPQTIVGYDDDGPKIFRLFPEGKDIHDDVDEEELGNATSIMDKELSLTSTNPVQNQAIARAVLKLENRMKTVEDATESDDEIHELSREIAVERARLDMLVSSGDVQSDVGTEVADVRVDIYGVKHESAGASVRSQVKGVMDESKRKLTDEQIEALDTMFKICSFSKNDISVEYDKFKVAFGIGKQEVVPTVIPATSIYLDTPSYTFTDQTTKTLTATVRPTNTTDTVKWSSSNESVAVVTNGVVKPISNGSATITAKAGNVSATCNVTVNIATAVVVTLNSITASYSGGTVEVGTSLNNLKNNLVVTANYSDGSSSAVTGYTLSGEIEEGVNTITVSYSGKTTTFGVVGVVSVVEPTLIPATKITLNKEEIIFTDTYSQQLIATVEPLNTTDTVVWTSGNESIATVTDGAVKPIADSGDGGTYVYATAGNVTASCYIKVDWEEEVEVVLTGISVSYSGGNVGIGTDVSNLTGVTVTAHYSDGTIATVNDYTLSGIVKLGASTITVEYHGFTTTFKVIGEETGFELGASSTFTTGVYATGTYGYTGVTVYASDTLEVVDGKIHIAETGREAVKLNPSSDDSYDASAYDKLKGKYVSAKFVDGTVYYIDEDATWKLLSIGSGQSVQYKPAYKVSIKEE